MNYFSETENFFKNTDPKKLIKKYGSPLYVYSEEVFRKRCKEMTSLVSYENFKVTYSIKANSNLSLLKIAHEEGMHADAMSPGEIFVLEKAGFKPEEIFYISNNVSDDEFLYAIEKKIPTSVDSVTQLERYGKLNPGGDVCVRFNPGIGDGHHQKVITGGKTTKFGVNLDKVSIVKTLLNKYKLRLSGINQHIGSLFMDGENYLKGVQSILGIAKQFDDLDFIDFGGGFGIPYNKQGGEQRLELDSFGEKFDEILNAWTDSYGKKPIFRIEPGRYISAEAGILLGTVYAKKNNYERLFIGTDLGFNNFIRPTLYGANHDIEIYRKGNLIKNGPLEKVDVVGNICESGDIIAMQRKLPLIQEGDILGVMDAGAYGYSMSCNYNNRLRPAEVLIGLDSKTRIIRRRDTLGDLIRNF